MAWNGSGTFSRTNGTNTGATLWAADAAASTKITTARHDTHDEDIATAISACLTKNMETKPTADFVPNATDTYDIGTTSLKWEDLHLNGDAAIGGEVDAASVGATIMGLIYPVGSVYTNKTDATNPATLFGVGTWVAIEDSFLIGASGTYAAESTGGSKDAIVVAHTHTIPIYGDSSAGSVTARAGTGGLNGNEVTSSTGSSGTDANLPPYVAVYMWERTA